MARNTVYNLLGLAVPLLVALFAIPPLVGGLGSDRFGVLALALTMIGYFTVFDLGMSRATTHFVAQDTSDESAPVIFWTSLGMLLGLGSVAALVAVVGTPWVVGRLLEVPPALEGETRRAFYVIAASLPFIFATGAPRGYLEARHRFDVINMIRVPSGALLFLGPLALLQFTHSLPHAVGALAVSRVLAFVAYMAYSLTAFPDVRQAWRISRRDAGRMVKFGVWVTLTNIFGSPMAMGYIDRLIIGSLLGVGAVTHYAIPFEVISKVPVLPAALTAVLFPIFSREHARSASSVHVLERASMRILSWILLPLSIVVLIFARRLLGLWLGPQLAAASAVVLQILIVGAVANAIAYVPFTFLQGFGRADLTAKRHMVQLPIYIILAVWLVRSFGVAGAAAGWTLWAITDAIALLLLRRSVSRPSAEGQ
jgi:O-antigen/teichoic acid export membrane protein